MIGFLILFAVGEIKGWRKELDPTQIVWSGLFILIFGTQLLMLKSIAKVISWLFLFGFLIVELMPEWDKSPAVTVNQIRLAGLFFLIPPILTAICWKALK